LRFTGTSSTFSMTPPLDEEFGMTAAVDEEDTLAWPSPDELSDILILRSWVLGRQTTGVLEPVHCSSSSSVRRLNRTSHGTVPSASAVIGAADGHSVDGFVSITVADFVSVTLEDDADGDATESDDEMRI
jgi:hypothetical protein